MNQKVKEIFSSQLMMSSTSYLVRTKLYPLERKVGSCKCRCNCCQVYRSITETDMFVCNNDQSFYEFYRSFDSNDKCLIYLLACNC